MKSVRMAAFRVSSTTRRHVPKATRAWPSASPGSRAVPRVKVRLYREVAMAPANAVPVAVVNAGFEEPVLGDGAYNGTPCGLD